MAQSKASKALEGTAAKNITQSRDAAEVNHVGTDRSHPRTPQRSADVQGENSPRTPNWKHVNRLMGNMNVKFPMMKDRMKLIKKSLEATHQMQTLILGKIDAIAENRKDGPPPAPPPRNEVEDLRRELERLRKSRGETFKLKILGPKPFPGDQSAKDLKNFLWDSEQYFKGAHVNDRDKVFVAAMYP